MGRRRDLRARLAAPECRLRIVAGWVSALSAGWMSGQEEADKISFALLRGATALRNLVREQRSPQTRKEPAERGGATLSSP